MAAAKYLCGAAVLASAVFSANVEESTAENPSEATVLSPQHAEAAAAATPQEEEVEAGRELWGAPAWGGHYYWPPRPYYGKGGKSGGNGSWSGGKGGKSGGDDDDGWSGWSGWSGRPSWGGWPADDDGYYYGKGGKSGSYGGKGAKSGSYSDDDDGWSWGGGWPGWGPPPPRPCYCPPGKSGKTKGGKTKGRGLEAESAGGGDAEGRQLWGSPWYGPHYSGCHCGWPNYGGYGWGRPPAWGGQWVYVGGWSHHHYHHSLGKSGKSGGYDDDGYYYGDDAFNWSGDGWTGPAAPNNDEIQEVVEIYSKGGHVAGWRDDGWDNDGYYKEDIDFVRAEIVKLVEASNRELIPKFIRLGFHDCVGGCDGCIDPTDADNRGLEEAIDAISYITDKYNDSYSRADVWALATLVSADLAITGGRPDGLHFPMRYIGRKDCSGADSKGLGGPEVKMPSNDFTTHELLEFFREYFGFDTEEVVVIMGVHSVGVAHRENVGFGHIGEESGWAFNAKDYILDNRYYGMLTGGEGRDWELELAENNGGIPNRYQWVHRSGADESPIMTNSDIALVRDLQGHIVADSEGNNGLVTCGYAPTSKAPQGYPTCPMARATLELMEDYSMDNAKFLTSFGRVLAKMLKNGY